MCLQVGVLVGMEAIDERFAQIESDWMKSDNERRKSSITENLNKFFLMMKHKPSLATCDSSDVVKFLIWKDSFGKTKVHDVACVNLGDKSKKDCRCPVRLAASTVTNMVHKMVDIFDLAGRGRVWDAKTCSGNPVCAPSVKNYCKHVALEQAKSHVVPRQAKPVFLSKIKRISVFIDVQLKRSDITPRRRFVLVRDQAFFKIQFFAGDRVADLSLVPSQEVKRLSDCSGLLFCHTVSKTMRGGDGKVNRFVIKGCQDKDICPVLGFDRYVEWCKTWGVDLSTGYLFRIVDEAGRVLDRPVSYYGMYSRLMEYLVTLNLYDGETPHGLRAGCAILMGMSGEMGSSSEIMNHVGWATEKSALYYSRARQFNDAAVVAEKIVGAASRHEQVEELFSQYVGSDLKNAVV